MALDVAFFGSLFTLEDYEQQEMRVTRNQNHLSSVCKQFTVTHVMDSCSVLTLMIMDPVACKTHWSIL